MQTRTLQVSFAAGELSERMLGRFDQATLQNGASTVRNFIVEPQGPVSRRPGFERFAATRNGTRARLIPFVGSSGGKFLIEGAADVFRVHTENGTVLHTPMQRITSISLANDTLGFPTPHGFTNDTPVVLFVSAGGTEPTGLALGTEYYVIAVDTVTVKLAASPGGAAINLTGTGSGTFRLARSADLQPHYRPPRTFTVTVATDATLFEFGSAHVFAINDPVEVYGFVGTALEQGVTYYVVGTTATGIRISTTLGGSAVALAVNLSGKVAYWNVNGDVMYYRGAYGSAVIRCVKDNPKDNAPSSVDYWQVQPEDGTLEIAHGLLDYQVFDGHYAIAVNTLAFVYPTAALRELEWRGGVKWALRSITHGSILPAPTGLVGTADRGQQLKGANVYNISGRAHIEYVSEHNLAPGDVVFNRVAFTSLVTANTYYVVGEVVNTRRVSLLTLAGDQVTWGGATTAIPGVLMYYASSSADTKQRYKVTSVTRDGLESTPSEYLEVDNITAVAGASNTITWSKVLGAHSYRVYKELNGLYGYIGESDGLSFLDDNIGPDMSATPPIFDDQFGEDDTPHAITHFGGRRVLASTTVYPEAIWFSRANTDNDFTYSLPIQPDDRILVRAREMHTVRNLVPLQDLIALTERGEWRISTVRNDGLAPDNVTVRAQSYIGCSEVQPVVVNNIALFCAARGGHVRELGYELQSQGFITGDVSLRAAHLFDGYEIRDLAYGKAPIPVVWAASTSGKLLGMTYVPEERVAGWHQHDIDGTVWACAVLPGATTDRLFVVVERDGVFSILRLGELQDGEAGFLDHALAADGAVTPTATLSGGRTWRTGDSVTITGSDPLFQIGLADVGDELRFADFAVRITSVTSDTVAVGALLADVAPSARGVALATAWARRTFRGLDHLEGEAVQLVADGAYSTATVAGGAVTLPRPAQDVRIGLGYISELTTVPVALQTDGAAQGRAKAVNHAWLRTLNTTALEIGVSATRFVEVNPEALVETRTMLLPEWTQEGRVTVRQTLPQAATITGLTFELSIG